jgi:hypothetical protein
MMDSDEERVTVYRHLLHPFESEAEYRYRVAEHNRKYRNWHIHKTMDKAKLVEVVFWDDATPEFLAEVYQTCSDRPLLKLDQHNRRPTSRGPLWAVLLELYKQERKYGSHKNSTPVEIWSMVVMDASFGLFKVVLNSNIQDVPYEELVPGSIVFFEDKEWRMLYHKDSHDGLKRGICFATNMKYDHAPCFFEEDDKKVKASKDKEGGNVTPDRHSARAHQENVWDVFRCCHD